MKILKYIFPLIFIFLLLSCSKNADPNPIEADTSLAEENINTEGDITLETAAKYYEYADDAVKNLLANYWNNNKKIFYDQYPKKTGVAFNYWWYAHGIDVLADAYIRTEDADYIAYADDVIGFVLKKNGKITNDYYDDMEWMALAILRLYNETGDEKYFEYVQTLWKDIKRGWNDKMGGGIAWRKEQTDYKNTPANAPAAILAARIYDITSETDDFEWAVKFYDFVKNNLVNEKTGQVWDGINRESNGKIDKDWKFTYCHGVYIGAGVELYKITGNKIYLDDAKKTAEYALNTFIESNGVFVAEVAKGETGGDGGLFKGILIRYLAELHKVEGNYKIEKIIKDNADILMEKGMNNVGNFSPRFNIPPENNEGYDLSVQLSGCMLLEMAVVINP